MFTTVKVPVMDDRLSPKKMQQLDRLTARDTTIIQRYLAIIADEEEHLWRAGQEGRRLDKTKLDALTLTSQAQKRTQPDGTVRTTQGRLTVQYDLKAQFGHRITVRELKEEFNLTAIYITHDLGIVAEITHRVAIMYAGQILEIGDTTTIFEKPAHPYTHGLISAIPNVKDETKRKLSSIPGRPPDLKNPPIGCRFADRCPFAIETCRVVEPGSYELPSKNNIEHSVKCFKYDPKLKNQFQ